MVKLFKYGLRGAYLIEKRRKKVDGLDQHQIIERPGISDDNLHEALQA